VINGQRVGYTRVSTLEQNTDRQLDGIELDRTFTDHVSGKDPVTPGHRRAVYPLGGFCSARPANVAQAAE